MHSNRYGCLSCQQRDERNLVKKMKILQRLELSENANQAKDDINDNLTELTPIKHIE